VRKVFWKTARTVYTHVHHPLKITCLDCGFLSLRSDEVTRADRVMLSARGRAGGCPSLNILDCSRSLWIDYDLTYVATDAGAIFDEVERDRRSCEGFFKYKPGWSPGGHKDLLLKALAFRQKVFFVVLGVFVTFLATWLGPQLLKLLGLG